MVRLLLVLLSILLYSCGGGTSVEYRSAKTYVSQQNYDKADSEALQGIQNNPDDALIPYFLALNIYGAPNSPKKNYAKTGEDTLINLECLIRGFRNVIANEFIMNGKENFGREGGCSEFRDATSDEKEHMKLVKKYGSHIIKPKNQFYDNRLGRARKFKIDCKTAYKSSQLNTLESFI